MPNRRGGRRFCCAAVVGALLLVGCSDAADPAPGAAGEPPGADGAQPPSPAEGEAAGRAGIVAEIDSLTWPEGFEPDVDQLVEYLGDPEENILTEQNGADLANIWNLCAWAVSASDQLADGASPDELSEAVAGVERWKEVASYDPALADFFLDDLRLGRPTSVNVFINDNTCRPYPHA